MGQAQLPFFKSNLNNEKPSFQPEVVDIDLDIDIEVLSTDAPKAKKKQSKRRRKSSKRGIILVDESPKKKPKIDISSVKPPNEESTQIDIQDDNNDVENIIKKTKEKSVNKTEFTAEENEHVPDIEAVQDIEVQEVQNIQDVQEVQEVQEVQDEQSKQSILTSDSEKDAKILGESERTRTTRSESNCQNAAGSKSKENTSVISDDTEEMKQTAKEKKELEKLERQKKKELEKQQRDQKKLKEQQEKEKRMKEREDEKKTKAVERELEKEMKRKRLEEEKLFREQKKEEERLKKISDREEKEKLRLEKKKIADEEKKKAEDEKKIAEEEKKKAEEDKLRRQPKLMKFFAIAKNHKTEENPKSDYELTFLPFYQKETCLMSPAGNVSDEQLERNRSLFSRGEAEGLKIFFKPNTNETESSTSISSRVVEALNSNEKSECEIYQMLAEVPFKFLSFYENIRHPYSGTFSKFHDELAQHPFRKVEDIDYSYDSDFIQEDDDEEGEEIEDEEPSETENEDGDSELEDFLDEDDKLNKRKIIGPLNPVIRWNTSVSDPLLEENQYERLHPKIDFPIDPFKNYWNPTPSSRNQSPKKGVTIVPSTPNKSETSAAASSSKKTKALITDRRYLYELSNFISSNNDFTISTLVDLAQRKFPGFTKMVIRNTIQDIAKRVGKSNDQKWEINEELLTMLRNEFEIKI